MRGACLCALTLAVLLVASTTLHAPASEDLTGRPVTLPTSAGHVLSVTPTDSAATYPVTFTEVGLPSGTNWSMSLNETTLSSVTSTITFAEPNGSYEVYTWDVKGYSSNAFVTTLNVRGAPVGVTVDYVPPPEAGFYYILFDQRGLPFNDYWTVDICFVVNGTERCGEGQTFFGPTHNPTGSDGVRNGTLEWYAQPSNLSEYPAPMNYPFPSHGQVVVNGSSVVVDLTFRFSYPYTFVAEGLPTTAAWTLGVLNQTFAGSGGPTAALDVQIPNGSFDWHANASGYRAQNGTVMVQGGRGSSTQEILFQALPQKPTVATWVWGVVGLVMAVGAIGAILFLRRLRGSRGGLPPPPNR